MPRTIFPNPKRAPRALLLTALLIAPLSAQVKDIAASAGEETGRFYGTSVKLGNGTARSYVTLDKGAASEVGIALSEDAMQNLPAGELHPEGHHFAEFLLPLPAEAARTSYKLIELDWNPGGHVPPGIYDLPHFDLHFYTITEEERNQIDPERVDFQTRAARVPAAASMPKGYMSLHQIMKIDPAHATLPRMGLHWVDPTSPELNGEKFTKTFIFGSWDGRMHFAEPMITKAYLESKPDVTIPLPGIADGSVVADYPSAYSIRYDAQAKEYRIALMIGKAQ